MQRPVVKKYFSAKKQYSQQNWLLSYSESEMKQNKTAVINYRQKKNSAYKKANIAKASAFQ